MVKLGKGTVQQLNNTNANIQEPKKAGRPKGSKNKPKPITADISSESHIDLGVYGKFNASDVELLPGSRFRVFKSGNLGLTNARFKVLVGDEYLIFGPANASFLQDRDDSWRLENNSTNNRSGFKVEELEGYEIDDDGNSNITDIIGDLNKRE